MPPMRRSGRVAAKQRSDPIARPQNPPRFVCVPCGGEEHEGRPAVTIQGNDMCQACFDVGFRPLFEAYLKDENSPVLWAGQAVSIDEVQNQLSADFVRQYRRRMEEYTVLPAQRLYCPTTNPSNCETFMGEKTCYKASRVCSSCKEKTCTQCAASLTGSTLANHECSKEAEIENPFEGMQRGRDWQACPGCSTAVNLREACNHLTCTLLSCRTHFCYLCGKEASPNDGTKHWDLGKPCAMYGPPRSTEQRLMELDRLELMQFCQKVESHIRQGSAQKPPCWIRFLSQARMIANILNVAVTLYNVRNVPELAARQILLRTASVDTRLAQLGAWKQFPALARIVARYKMAKDGKWNDLRAQLATRRGAERGVE